MFTATTFFATLTDSQAPAQLRSAAIYYTITGELEIIGNDVTSPITGETYYTCYEAITQPQKVLHLLQQKINANRQLPDYRSAFVIRQDWYECLSTQEQTVARHLANKNQLCLDQPNLMLTAILQPAL